MKSKNPRFIWKSSFYKKTDQILMSYVLSRFSPYWQNNTKFLSWLKKKYQFKKIEPYRADRIYGYILNLEKNDFPDYIKRAIKEFFSSKKIPIIFAKIESDGYVEGMRQLTFIHVVLHEILKFGDIISNNNESLSDAKNIFEVFYDEIRMVMQHESVHLLQAFANAIERKLKYGLAKGRIGDKKSIAQSPIEFKAYLENMIYEFNRQKLRDRKKIKKFIKNYTDEFTILAFRRGLIRDFSRWLNKSGYKIT